VANAVLGRWPSAIAVHRALVITGVDPHTTCPWDTAHRYQSLWPGIGPGLARGVETHPMARRGGRGEDLTTDPHSLRPARTAVVQSHGSRFDRRCGCGLAIHVVGGLERLDHAHQKEMPGRSGAEIVDGCLDRDLSRPRFSVVRISSAPGHCCLITRRADRYSAHRQKNARSRPRCSPAATVGLATRICPEVETWRSAGASASAGMFSIMVSSPKFRRASAQSGLVSGGLRVMGTANARRQCRPDDSSGHDALMPK